MQTKIVVDKQALITANEKSKSASAAAASLGISYQTFCRRCEDAGIPINKNQSARGVSADRRYGLQKAKEMAKQTSELIKRRQVTLATREKLRKAALQRIDNGRMPSKGLKGYYAGIWFDSSWELAYFIWMAEVNNITPLRNTKIFFDYIDDNGHRRRTKPDFILPDGSLIEIKGYPNIHTAAKFRATSMRVLFLFKKDLLEPLSYVKQKYGENFTKTFYATVGKLVDPAE